jgi:hypothetical protein
MTDSGKSLIVTKVYEKNCDICNHMSKHDRVTFESYSEVGFQEVLLDDVINHSGNLTKLRLYQCLEKYALNPDYTIDLPVYVFLTKAGKYKNNIVGSATISELREKIDECLEDTPE